MKKIMFVGGGIDERVISKKDWSGLDIDQEKTVWNRDNNFTLEVSDEAAEHLLKKEADFKEVSDDEDPPRDMMRELDSGNEVEAVDAPAGGTAGTARGRRGTTVGGSTAGSAT